MEERHIYILKLNKNNKSETISKLTNVSENMIYFINAVVDSVKKDLNNINIDTINNIRRKYSESKMKESIDSIYPSQGESFSQSNELINGPNKIDTSVDPNNFKETVKSVSSPVSVEKNNANVASTENATEGSNQSILSNEENKAPGTVASNVASNQSILSNEENKAPGTVASNVASNQSILSNEENKAPETVASTESANQSILSNEENKAPETVASTEGSNQSILSNEENKAPGTVASTENANEESDNESMGQVSLNPKSSSDSSSISSSDSLSNSDHEQKSNNDDNRTNVLLVLHDGMKTNKDNNPNTGGRKSHSKRKRRKNKTYKYSS
jgi:hypothetical protein